MITAKDLYIGMRVKLKNNGTAAYAEFPIGSEGVIVDIHSYLPGLPYITVKFEFTERLMSRAHATRFSFKKGAVNDS